MENSENKAIDNCKKGNLKDFAILYDLYVKKIYRFIYYKTHHKETTEDLVSDTFTKALDKIDSFNKEKASFSCWLYTIARNSVIDFYRTKKTSFNIEDVWDLKSDSDTERDLGFSEEMVEVKKYLGKLSAKHREIVILRVWEGMSYKEIASIMDKTESSAKMMFSRVITDLRKELGPLAVMLLFVARFV